MARFAFRFTRWHRILGAPFGVTPATTMVDVVDDRLIARLGPWVVETSLDNVEGVVETGPYALLKTAGPAHLSLADRGLTMATNRDRGLCLRFTTPVPGIDPFGWIRHPGLTVTVERIEDLRRVIEDGELADGLPTTDIPRRSPWQRVGPWVRWPAGMALAAARYVASAGTVRRSFESRGGPPPDPMSGDGEAGLQRMDQGVGPAYERVYRITIGGTDLTPEQLLERVASHLNAVSPTEVAEFRTAGPEDATGTVGEQYRIRMPGPWDARVRVLHRSPTSLRLATLKGHMEAGEIQFSAVSANGGVDGGPGEALVFEIRSVARSGDRGFELLYRALSIGMRMQEYMWVHMCCRVATIAEGRRHGPITVRTIRYAG